MMPQSLSSALDSTDASEALPELVPEIGKMAQVYPMYPKTLCAGQYFPSREKMNPSKLWNGLGSFYGVLLGDLMKESDPFSFWESNPSLGKESQSILAQAPFEGPDTP